MPGCKTKRESGGLYPIGGHFKIKTPLDVELYFTNVAMKPSTYRVKKAAAGVNIFMVEDVTEIEETVIVGQRRVNKASVTSSNFVVRAEDWQKTPVANVMSLLQGRVQV